MAVVGAAAGFGGYAFLGPRTVVVPSVPVTPGGTANPNDLVKLSDVPDNGGVVLAQAKVVVTRAGQEVKAFTAVCTHQGCIVAGVRAGRIECACHGSAFNATTGAVVNGPAGSPLAPVAVTVVDGTVRRG